MNKQEWSKQPNRQSTDEYKTVHKLLDDWKQQNGITKRCVVHHRDDNDEVRSYNESHYERWGLNPDGTFEYGKYVLFMTDYEHAKHHHTGKRLSVETRRLIGVASKARMTSETKQKISREHKGKVISEEQKVTVSAKLKGRIFSDEHKQKLKNKTRGLRILYNAYRANNGILKWNNFKTAITNGDITFEMQPISVFINKESTNDHN